MDRPSSRSSASNLPGPQLRSTCFTCSCVTPRRLATGVRSGASDAIRPMSRSRFAQPSSRRPIPGWNESSTVEWQMAHWIPIDVSAPSERNPFTPTTASRARSSSVTLGSSRLTSPASSARLSEGGSCSESTLRPASSAAVGLSAATASWSRSSPPQKSSSPKVSWRKVKRPSRIMRAAFASGEISTALGLALDMKRPLASTPNVPRPSSHALRRFCRNGIIGSSLFRRLCPQASPECRWQAWLGAAPSIDVPRPGHARGPDRQLAQGRTAPFTSRAAFRAPRRAAGSGRRGSACTASTRLFAAFLTSVCSATSRSRSSWLVA